MFPWPASGYAKPKVSPREKFLISLPCAKQQIAIVCVVTFCRPLADRIFWVGRSVRIAGGSGPICRIPNPGDRGSQSRGVKKYPELQNNPLNDSLIHVDFVRALNITL